MCTARFISRLKTTFNHPSSDISVSRTPRETPISPHKPGVVYCVYGCDPAICFPRKADFRLNASGIEGDAELLGPCVLETDPSITSVTRLGRKFETSTLQSGGRRRDLQSVSSGLQPWRYINRTQWRTNAFCCYKAHCPRQANVPRAGQNAIPESLIDHLIWGRRLGGRDPCE